MSKRKIIKIDEEKCNGCGLCIPNCPEGALQIIDGKARLISDLFCDGLGACIGHCPKDAITVEERQAKPYDEKKVMENIIKQGKNVIKAHILHLKEHGEREYLKQAMDVLNKKGIEPPSLKEDHSAHLHGGCPGSKVMEFTRQDLKGPKSVDAQKRQSELRQWPVQIMLVPASAPYFNGADLLIAADCVAFSYADFHNDFLKGKVLLVGCPKLDDAGFYKEKITEIFKNNDIRSVTCVHMEVPCCFGLVSLIKEALKDSGKKIGFKEITIGIKGEVK